MMNLDVYCRLCCMSFYIMLSDTKGECHYDERNYAECHNAEYHYAVCYNTVCHYVVSLC